MGDTKKETPTIDKFVNEWRTTFTERIKELSKSRKQDFTFADALKRCKSSRSDLDKLMIQYLNFVNSEPLKNNDYFKFVNSYKQGKKLNEKYFRHDLKKLNEYYKKSDEDEKYNPFSEYQYKKYVLFMMLKFSGLYLDEYDGMFKVSKKESREYNPITNIPSVLRQYLPFQIKEYDIAQAYPTFLFLDLNIKPFDVYSQIDKRLFNITLNTHHENKGITIEAVRSKLKPIYKERVNEVMTDERFNNRGQMFRDLAKYEAEYIQKFVDANKLKKYVRLHDGVVTLEQTQCDVLEFGIVKFKTKEFLQPEQLSNIVNFYGFDEEGKLKTTPVTYSRFFEQENFIRITREGHDHLTILKNENRIVTPINHKTDLVPYLKENINEFDSALLEDRIARDATSVIQQSLQLLTPIPLQYHRDTKTTCDIPFKNGVARITTDGMGLVSYSDIDGFFTKHTTQQHEISFVDVDNEPSDFRDFLILACTGTDGNFDEAQEDAIMAFCSMFGYLISNYKNPAFNPAIILSDEGADGENRNGGRGKSLVQRALSYFRPSIEKGGNAYDPNYTHVHADLKKEHDLYLLDDVASNFNYNALYTHITGSIDAQRKGMTAETISFEDAPKFVISTNWAVRYDAEATSTNRRFKEYKFSDFWNINNTPDTYFGKSFFTDWDADEWNAFYNFGFFCVQHYLKNGLQAIEYDKKADNFRAYFYNDSLLEEMARILDLLDSQDSFSVTEFINHHQSSDVYRYKPEFTIRNAKKYIDTFIEFEKLPYLYSQRVRKWEKMKY